MSDRTSPRSVEETPIERIFQKVMQRKMTQDERFAFRLEPIKNVKIHKEVIKKNGSSINGGNGERAGS